MKKKILAIIVAATMTLSIIGCTSYQEAANISQENESVCGGYFTVINKWYDWKYDYCIVASLIMTWLVGLVIDVTVSYAIS